MTEEDRKLLTEASGMEWHEIYVCPTCGFTNSERFQFCYCDPPVQVTKKGRVPRSFSTPDDWELVREKVVAGDRLLDFDSYLLERYDSLLVWFLTLSPEQRCQLVADWLKERA